MARGGARNRSGPAADPTSGRSDRRGFKLDALPVDGYRGDPPEFPLPSRVVLRWEFQDKAKFQVPDTDATEATKDREIELWEWAWSLPQACAWSMPRNAWMLMSIAMWVRTFVICEGTEATAADKGSLHRFADQIGMTTAGLAEMGWRIGEPEKATAPTAAEPQSGGSRSRLKLVSGG